MKDLKLILLGAILFSFSYANAQWVQDGPNIIGEAYYDLSGGSVSMSDDGMTVAIGAERNDAELGDSETGHVRVYRNISGTWTQLGADIDGTYLNGYFGKSVSISANGNIVAIGAPYNGEAGGNAGQVNIYEYNGSVWNQLGNSINGAGGNSAGGSVSLSDDGHTIAIGATEYNSSTGMVMVYQFSGSWNLKGSEIYGETSGDRFGTSVSLSWDGNTLAVGAKNHDAGGSNAGNVRIFDYSGSWNQKGASLNGLNADDAFGSSVSLDSNGDFLAVGAYGNDNGGNLAGQVRTFEYSGGSWNSFGASINGNPEDFLGWSVSLSSDGNTLAVGATITTSGTGPGYVSIYRKNGINWDIESTVTGDINEDTFGKSVSLNADGNMLAAGAMGSDIPEISIGYTKIFKYTTPPPCIGDGTSINPYQIETLDHLEWVSQTDEVWDKHFIQIADIDASGTTSWGAYGFTCIGSSTTPFTGSYNGQGHKIDNLYVNYEFQNYFGFIGSAENAIIENLGITNCDISGSNNSAWWGWVGALVGQAVSTTVNNCYSTGSISASSRTGGIIGYSTSASIITNCYSTCTITDVHDAYNGGIAGVNRGGSIIEDSYFAGSVIGNGSNFGGIAGYNDDPNTIIRNCYNLGEISGNNTVGGIAGYSDTLITNCYSAGQITGGANTGGLLGLAGALSVVEESFWDTETSGQASSAGGTGKTTAEMSLQNCYTDAGWDFENETTNGTNDNWKMDSHCGSIYPILSWEPTSNPPLIANYSFNNNANDVSGNGFNGTVDGAILTTDRFGSINSAYYFDGIDDKIVLPDLGIFGTFTLSIWINTETIEGTNQAIFGSESWLSEDMHWNFGENTQIAIADGSTSYMSSSYSFANDTNKWVHLVYVFTGGSPSHLYINSVLDVSHTNSGNVNFDNMFIGHCFTDRYFYGKIDDVQIYNCALDSNQIEDIYHEGNWELPFVTECLDFNDNLVPENWELLGDSAFIDNGKFMTVKGDGDGAAIMFREGTMPENLDSVIIEWDSQVLNGQEFQFTMVALGIADSIVMFMHAQEPNNDVGTIGNFDGSLLATDSMSISTGIYRNRVVCTNTNMFFTSYKITENTIIPFQLEIDPFLVDSNYSLSTINTIVLWQLAETSYNWMDNVCISLVEHDASEVCEIATYKFNSNRADNSGNGYHLTEIENGPVIYGENRFGEAGKALMLNINNQEVFTNNPNVPNLNGDFAISTWVKALDYTGGTDTAMIFSNYPEDSGSNSFMIGLFEVTGQIFFGHVNNGENLIIDLSDQILPANIWTHLALSRDSLTKQYTFYYNGDSVRSFDYLPQPDATGPFYNFSISDNNPNFSFKGSVDDLRLWQCTTTASIIDSIYHMGGWPQVMCDDLLINVSTINAACNMNTGTATVTTSGGSGAYSITWSNGDEGINADELPAGMHSVQVTDTLYGCMLNQFFNINNIAAPSLIINPMHNNCYGASIGSLTTITTGGTSPYLFEWSTGELTENISDLSASTYFVTVIDAAGCVITGSEVISEPTEITATFSITNSSCGNNDGEIIITPSGGMDEFTYNWENGTTDSTNTDLLAGSYSVTVEDMFGCQEIFTSAFSDLGSPMAMVDSTISASCGELGSLYISASGGSGTYGYEWSNGETTEDLVGFAPGEYWLTVTDGTCTAMLNASIPFNYPQTQEICVVTVDPTTATNLVVWEKETATNIDHYNIYREGFVAGDYELVGAVAYDDMSEYSDPVASPFNRSWKYKVSAVDGCENESNLSADHKTIHLTINLGLGGSINLVWDDYAGFNYSSFYIKKHTTVGGWVVLDQLPTYLHSYSDTPADLYGLWYSVTVDAPGECVPTSADKASGGPYYQSVSNIEDEGSIDLKVSTISEDYHISLFPNPNNGRFMVGFGEAVSGNIQVVDITGKTILSDKIQKQDKWINDRTLESGIYLVKINIENEGVQIIKMIVE